MATLGAYITLNIMFQVCISLGSCGDYMTAVEFEGKK